MKTGDDDPTGGDHYYGGGDVPPAPPGPTVRAPLSAPATLNRFAVGVGETGIVILNLPLQARRGDLVEGGAARMARMPEWPAVAPLSRAEAHNLAAWLVALAGDRKGFLRLLDAVERA